MRTLRARLVLVLLVASLVVAGVILLAVQWFSTQQIAELLMEKLDPKGVGCVVEAAHLCTMMRGVQKPGTRMLTSAMLGRFRRDAKTRSEFLALIGKPGA